MTTDSSTAPLAAPQPASGRRFFWERGRADLPEGGDLAALRRGVGRDAGSVPEMWAFYRRLNAEGFASSQLKAEHAVLTLYAIHQQSQSEPMHRSDVGVGKAIMILRQGGKFSEDAVDRRFGAAATATSLNETAYHLRGLIRQLRQLPQGLDYTRLFHDLVAWQDPDRIGTVRRRWGSDYFVGRQPPEKPNSF